MWQWHGCEVHSKHLNVIQWMFHFFFLKRKRTTLRMKQEWNDKIPSDYNRCIFCYVFSLMRDIWWALYNVQSRNFAYGMLKTFPSNRLFECVFVLIHVEIYYLLCCHFSSSWNANDYQLFSIEFEHCWSPNVFIELYVQFHLYVELGLAIRKFLLSREQFYGICDRCDVRFYSGCDIIR